MFKFREALAIDASLANAGLSTDADTSRDLGISLQRMGQLALALGNAPLAYNYFLAVTRRDQALAGGHPTIQQALDACSDTIGLHDAAVAAGQVDLARNFVEAVMPLCQTMVDHAVADAVLPTAYLRWRHANILAVQGNLRAARQELEPLQTVANQRGLGKTKTAPKSGHCLAIRGRFALRTWSIDFGTRERTSMGSFGGGSQAARDTCEASLKLDLAAPAIRSALHPRANTSGTWRWSRNGDEVAAIAYAWESGETRLTLRYSCNGTPVLQTIHLLQTKPHFGGARFWFCCPFADKPVRALYLPAGARLWGSRAHHGLAYQSQRDSGWERFALQWLARAGSPLARAALQDQALLGLRDERRWEQRRECRRRRNEVRCIARRQRNGS